jgi:hyperosmotically inducible protein
VQASARSGLWRVIANESLKEGYFMFTSKTNRTVAVVLAALAATSLVAHAAGDTTPSAPERAASKAEAAVSDSWITTKVKSEILANSVSKAFKVHVTTKNGAVSLKGELPNKDAVELVKMIAEKVKGVQSVDTKGLTVTG